MLLWWFDKSVSKTRTNLALKKHKNYLLMFQGSGKCQTSAQTDGSSKELQTSTTTEQDKEG